MNWTADEDESDHDWDDDFPGEEENVIPCESCGRLMYDDADVCPYCGQFQIGEVPSGPGRPKWFVALGILGVIATILSMLVLF